MEHSLSYLTFLDWACLFVALACVAGFLVDLRYARTPPGAIFVAGAVTIALYRVLA